MPKLLIEDVGGVGFVKDLPPHRLPPNAWTDAYQVRFGLEGASQIAGDREVFDSAATVPIWLSQFPPLADPLWLYATAETSGGANDGELRVVGPSITSPHPEVSRAGTKYGTVTNERPQGFVFQNLGIWNNTQDIPQLWGPIATGTLMVDITNWATNPEGADARCKWLRPHKNFLIGGYWSDVGTGDQYPFRVRWSDAAVPGSVPSSWDPTDATKLAGEFDIVETSDYVIDGLTLGETFMVYKEKSVWGMQFVGGTSTFRLWKLFNYVGIMARDCAAQFPGGHFVVGQDDIYVHVGTPGSAQSIVQDRLRRWLFRRINPDFFYNCFVCPNPSSKEIWFCFPSSAPEGGATEAYADIAMIWNWEKNSWGIRDLPDGGIPFAYPGPVGLSTGEPATWT